ncbi:hypothetical protein [Paenibacillus aceris]|uniref:Uncharacterized protein n=1 Tax=Paenibacillus aceris TaxID=869555 RepID=A0ABS4HRJ4_9BACL|nr:hypothetical protein [Paenibacillus aceris]MBP1961170.1 hypothetical protein [Paenibacillus aceris]NHW35177.1 hypothetical protein [Paenibacillus aceris]
MLNKIVLWTVLIGPWFTLFLIKKENIKRFMPAAIFASYLMIIYNVVAMNQKHWVINETLIPWLKPLFVSGVFGAFPVITLWVFYFTYGKFWKYIIANIIMDFMFAVFPIHYLFQEVLGIYKLVNITPWGRFFLFVFFSIVIYGYYKWQEDLFHSKPKRT